MWTRLNVLIVFALSSLYGQSLGFWPFDFVAAQRSLHTDKSDGSAKRIAIIGVSNFFLVQTILCFPVPRF
jgi:hypothetical protein